MSKRISARGLFSCICAAAVLFAALSVRSLQSAPKATPAPAPASGPANPAVDRAEPANVVAGPDSLASYLHFPKSLPAANTEAAAQFYCDVTPTGEVETTYRVVAREEEFRTAVQSALDWGKFKPATLGGKPVAAYVAGTVLFLHRNGEALIVVSLATQDRERVGKFVNYIQPQLIGGLRSVLGPVLATLPGDINPAGSAEVVVKVTAQGSVASTAMIEEDPKTSGLGALLESGLKSARFTPAYADGKPAAGEINVVATFSDATAE